MEPPRPCSAWSLCFTSSNVTPVTTRFRYVLLSLWDETGIDRDNYIIFRICSTRARITSVQNCNRNRIAPSRTRPPCSTPCFTVGIVIANAQCHWFTELGYFSMPSRFCRDYWSPVSPDSCRLRDCACTQTCCSSAPTSAKLWGWYRPGLKRIGKLCNLYQVGNGHLQQKVILFDCLRMCLYLEPRFVWQKIYWRGCGLFICQQPSWKTIDVL